MQLQLIIIGSTGFSGEEVGRCSRTEAYRILIEAEQQAYELLTRATLAVTMAEEEGPRASEEDDEEPIEDTGEHEVMEDEVAEDEAGDNQDEDEEEEAEAESTDSTSD